MYMKCAESFLYCGNWFFSTSFLVNKQHMEERVGPSKESKTGLEIYYYTGLVIFVDKEAFGFN